MAPSTACFADSSREVLARTLLSCRAVKLRLVTLHVLALAMTGCSAGEDVAAVDLQVLVRTDLVAGREFAWVEVALPERGRTVRLPAVVGSHQGVTEAAFFERLPRSAHRLVRVSLLDARGSVVLSRPMVFPHERRLAVVAKMSRACRDHACPEACQGGRCVDSDCVEGTEESCETPEAPECTADDDCPSSAPCSVGRCDAEECWLDVLPDACGAGETCDVELGCVALPEPEPPMMDAGVPPEDDAGVTLDAGDVLTDVDGGAAEIDGSADASTDASTDGSTPDGSTDGSTGEESPDGGATADASAMDASAVPDE